MIKKDFISKHLCVIVAVSLIFSICCNNTNNNSASQRNDSQGKIVRKLTDREEEYFSKLNELLGKDKFEKVIELSNKYLEKDFDNAIYHQFKGLAYVYKYEKTLIFPSKSYIEKAVNEFQLAKELDSLNEDKATAGITLAYIASKDFNKAKDVFEPALKKYPKSIHLNYVGIKYYEKIDDKSMSLACSSFVAENNPQYNGKPVFIGIGVVLSLSALLKILTSAIVVGYVTGYANASGI